MSLYVSSFLAVVSPLSSVVPFASPFCRINISPRAPLDVHLFSRSAPGAVLSDRSGIVPRFLDPLLGYPSQALIDLSGGLYLSPILRPRFSLLRCTTLGLRHQLIAHPDSEWPLCLKVSRARAWRSRTRVLLHGVNSARALRRHVTKLHREAAQLRSPIYHTSLV